MIEITFKNGEVTQYKRSEYTDYSYDGKCFIVINNMQWVGIYNLDCIESVEVSR